MNRVVHFEIAARDPHKAKAFYEGVFGWQITEGEMVMNISDQEAGISGHILSWPHEHPTYVSVYIKVEDVQTYLDKAVAQGGQIIVPPTKIPTGTFGMFLDPEGHPIGILQD